MEKQDLGYMVNYANDLDKQGYTSTALDSLLGYIDNKLHMGVFSELDQSISQLNLSELSINILVCILTSTLPAKSKLPSRTNLFSDIEKILKSRGEYEEGLLTGLN